MYIDMRNYDKEELNEADRRTLDMMQNLILNVDCFKDSYLFEKDEGMETVNKLREEILSAFTSELINSLESDADMFIVSCIDGYEAENESETA